MWEQPVALPCRPPWLPPLPCVQQPDGLRCMPPRELQAASALAAATLPQVVLGSLAIALGLAAGACTSSLGEIWAEACSYETARLALAAALVCLHRRENIAKP